MSREKSKESFVDFLLAEADANTQEPQEHLQESGSSLIDASGIAKLQQLASQYAVHDADGWNRDEESYDEEDDMEDDEEEAVIEEPVGELREANADDELEDDYSWISATLNTFGGSADRDAIRQLLQNDDDEEDEDMDEEDFADTLRSASGIGKARKKSQGGPKVQKVPLHLQIILGQANLHYVNHNYPDAIDLFQQVITEDPTVHQPWVSLGMIYEELGDISRSLTFQVVAAHLSSGDVDTWKRLAEKYVEQEQYAGALHCLGQAVQLHPEDVNALWDRAFLFKKMGKRALALRSFRRLLQLVPHHQDVLMHLAQLLKEGGQTQEAIKVYEAELDYNRKMFREKESTTEIVKTGYGILNALAELYRERKEYAKALKMLRREIRRLQGRAEETHWDKLMDDREFLGESAGATDLLMELRVHMGICRLHVGPKVVAKEHFQYLYDAGASAFPDLFQDVALAYYDVQMFEEAVEVLDTLFDEEEEIDLSTLVLYAQCHRRLQHFEMAEQHLKIALELSPGNREVMLALVEVYEALGRNALADELMAKVATLEPLREDEDQQEEKKPKGDLSFFQGDRPQEDDIPKQPKKNPAAERAAREREMREREEIITTTWSRLRHVWSRLDAEPENAKHVESFLQLAATLWKDFAQTKQLFYQDRTKVYRGLRAHRTPRESRRRLLDDDDDRAITPLQGLSTRTVQNNGAEIGEDVSDQGMEEDNEDMPMRPLPGATVDTLFGVHFNEWLRMIAKYALMLASTGRRAEAYAVLSRAAQANVFYHDIHTRTSLKLVEISCSVRSGDHEHAANAAREICTVIRMYKSDAYRIFGAASPSGYYQTAHFCHPNHSRGFLRNLKSLKKTLRLDETAALDNDAMDVDVQAEPSPKKASQSMLETSKTYDPNQRVAASLAEAHEANAYHPTKFSIPLCALVGHTYLCSGSYGQAMGCYLQAYRYAQQNPLLNLSLAVAALMKAMNKRALNRHYQIIQCFTFFYKYAKYRGEGPETEYNFGRAFQQIGLSHLAVYHYEKALDLIALKKEDESASPNYTREIAFNLHLLYIMSGSMHLAQWVLEQYCTI